MRETLGTTALPTSEPFSETVVECVYVPPPGLKFAPVQLDAQTDPQIMTDGSLGRFTDLVCKFLNLPGS